jgi:hypothetical protein
MAKNDTKLKTLLNEVNISLLDGIKTGNDGPSYARGWDGKVLYEMDDEGKPVDNDSKPTEKKKLLFGQEEEGSKEVTKEMKNAFREAVADFNKYSESIYREGNLKEICKEMLQIGKLAEQIALEETDDWSDISSIQRDFKSLNDALKNFEKTAKDVTILQKRLEGNFENIGSILNRYYDIKDVQKESVNNKKKAFKTK